MYRTIIFLTVFLLSSAAVWAYQPIDTSIHGSNLKHASFVIRYKFEQKMHKSWQSSTYAERNAFLSEWYIQQKFDEKKLYLEKKAEVVRERDIEKSKDRERKRLEGLAKQNERAVKEEIKSKKILKKNVDKRFEAMQRELKLKSHRE